MSTQRGNTNRTRSQKHKNLAVFNNSMHDTSKRTKQLNNMEVHGVCQRCKDIIDWKIKYKKYKPLTAPKTCTKCHEKTITGAYRTICKKCSDKLKVCEKCGESKEVIQRTTLTYEEQSKMDAEIQKELKKLPERRRRTLLRYMAKMRDNPEQDPASAAKDIREKIEKVKERLDKGLDDDLDDLSLGENSDSDNEEESEEEES